VLKDDVQYVDENITSPTIIDKKCNDAPDPTTENFTFKKFTWISVSNISVDKIKGECTSLTDDSFTKIPRLKKALEGAAKCDSQDQECSIPRGVSLDCYSAEYICYSDSDYKITLSPAEAGLVLGKVRFVSDKYVLYSFVKYQDKYYQVVLLTSDESRSAEVMLHMEPFEPVTQLSKGHSVNYTVIVQTLATFGTQAQVKLETANPAKDSGLSIRFDPETLSVSERSSATSKMIVSADKDAKEGQYTLWARGNLTNGGDLIGFDGGVGFDFPTVQIGNSSWNIRTFGQGSNVAYGIQKPLEKTFAELELDKESYEKGETVEIKAFLVNNSTERIILNDNPSLIIHVIKGIDVGYYDNLYRIEANDYSSKKTILEPHSRTLLVRPFYWDQNTFWSDGIPPQRLESRQYKMEMSFGSYHGIVWNDEVWFEIK
jgi:hypothetical protein